jgi:hypothetical protein
VGPKRDVEVDGLLAVVAIDMEAVDHVEPVDGFSRRHP